MLRGWAATTIRGNDGSATPRSGPSRERENPVAPHGRPPQCHDVATDIRPRTEGAFGAIADPTRRAILDLLRDRELAAGEIARRFAVSRPAIARHVRVLREAGPLRERRAATQRFYSLHPAALEAVEHWLGPYRRFWAPRAVDLERVAESDRGARRRTGES